LFTLAGNAFSAQRYRFGTDAPNQGLVTQGSLEQGLDLGEVKGQQISLGCNQRPAIVAGRPTSSI
jgi:hypothetical protein